MLMAHQKDLKAFALYFPSSPFLNLSAFFCQDWCYIKLPNLRELTIQTPHMGLCKEFFDYIHLFASSLVTLTISGHRLSYQEAEQLSSKLADFRFLRHLTLGIRGLSPSILAIFARTVPWLSHLILRYNYISIDEDEHPFELHELPALVSWELQYKPLTCIHICAQFSRSMQSYTHLFSQWALESFDFGADMAALSNAKIKKILINFLPNVVWFCDVEREECIRNLLKLRLTMMDSKPTFPYMSIAMV